MEEKLIVMMIRTRRMIGTMNNMAPRLRKRSILGFWVRSSFTRKYQATKRKKHTCRFVKL